MVMVNGVPFTSVQDLLTWPDEVPWGALAEEIECRGVYKLMSKTKEVRHFGSYTVEAQEALNAIAFDLAVSRRPHDPDFETWYLEQDPTYVYGWPKDKLPSFKPLDEYPWMEAFSRTECRAKVFASSLCTVGRLLLTRKANTGQLATVIERHGVHGFDRFNRSARFGPETSEVQAVLSALADYASADRADPIRAVEVIGRYEFADYGWPPDDLPDFDAAMQETTPMSAIVSALGGQLQLPATAAQPAAAASSIVAAVSPKSENADKALIAALAKLLVEPGPSGEQPMFGTRQALIDHLDEQYGSLHVGLATRTLKTKLPDAINRLDSAIQEQQQRAAGRRR